MIFKSKFAVLNVFILSLGFIHGNVNRISRRDLLEALLSAENAETSNRRFELEGSMLEESKVRAAEIRPVSTTPSLPWEQHPMPCNESDGTILKILPEKCMQLECRKRIIVTVYLYEKGLCNCCEHAGRLYREGDELPGVCEKMFCCDGEWVSTGHIDECCQNCDVFGDPHIKTFDARTSPINWYNVPYVNCNFTITQQLEPNNIGSYDPDFAVYATVAPCQESKTSSCLDVVTFKDNSLTNIQVFPHDMNAIWINGDYFTLGYTPTNVVDNAGVKHPVLAWKQPEWPWNCMRLLGSQGLMLHICPFFMRVFAYASLYEDIGGLCGHYNGYDQDDHMTREGIVENLAYYPNPHSEVFVNSWKAQNYQRCARQSNGFQYNTRSRIDSSGKEVGVNIDALKPDLNCDKEENEQLYYYCSKGIRENPYPIPEDMIINLIEACVFDICIAGSPYREGLMKYYYIIAMDQGLILNSTIGPHEHIEPPCSPVGNNVTTVTMFSNIIGPTITKTTTVTTTEYTTIYKPGPTKPYATLPVINTLVKPTYIPQ